MDSERVSRFLAGDHEAIREVQRTIRAVVRRFRGLPDTAEGDLCQEALVRVFLSVAAGRFRGDASLSTFAGNVARFTYLESLRRRRVMQSLVGEQHENAPATESTVEDSMIREEEMRAGLRAAARLPPDSLELIRLVFVERLPYPEVAARLGISEGTLRVRIHRCRARLAEALAVERKPRDSKGQVSTWRLRDQRAD